MLALELATSLPLRADETRIDSTNATTKAGQIDAVVSHYAAYGYLNGAVLVADHGKVIYSKGVGYANAATHTLNTPETKFGIASLTKQFTAVLVLQQASEGKLSLDGKLADYLPWYRKDTGGRITIEQLLHHTSGLPPDYDLPEFSDSDAALRHYEPQEFAQKLCQPNLTSAPGAKWQYSNCGYNLLGLILERITGKPFGDLLHERLLQPLGMNHTGMDRNDLVQSGGAQGYLRKPGPRLVLGPNLDRIHIYSAGAMYSTVEDLFLWSQALSDSGSLPKEIRAQIFQPGLSDWGYGWFVTKLPPGQPGAGSTLAEMRGDMPGNYFSWILRFPERNAVIIVLRNAYGSTERLEQNLQAVLFDQLPVLPSRSAKDIAAQIWIRPANWAGTHVALSLILVLLAIGAALTCRLKKAG
jgi:CubicO group peptidase (beta-lactamase class C family)